MAAFIFYWFVFCCQEDFVALWDIFSLNMICYFKEIETKRVRIKEEGRWIGEKGGEYVCVCVCVWQRERERERERESEKVAKKIKRKVGKDRSIIIKKSWEIFRKNLKRKKKKIRHKIKKRLKRNVLREKEKIISKNECIKIRKESNKSVPKRRWRKEKRGREKK